MAANEIKIIVGGDVGGLVRASQQSSTALDAMGKAAATASKDFSQLAPSAQTATKAVERLKQGLRDPSSGSTTALSQGFQSALRPIEELEAELQVLHNALRKTTDPRQLVAFGREIERIKLQINNIKVVTFSDSLNKVNQSAAQAAAGLRKIQPGANEATFALTNLSRIAQDAPFGFIGIANNINPMLESFQRLKAQTGTTQSAFKALISSISGAGGLGLAVGLGSAALTLLGQGFFSGGRAAKKAAEDVDEFKKVLEDAASDMARDASRVTTLFNALSGGTLNFEERKSALKELQSINKDFFGSLKEEEGLIKGLQAAYDGYLERLQDIGRAKAIESQLTKLFDKKLQLELSIDSKFIGATNQSIQRSIGKAREELEKLGGALNPEELKQQVNFFDQTNKSLSRRIQLQERIKELEKGIEFLPDAGVGAVQNQIRNIDLQIAGLSELQKATGEFQLKTDQGNKKEEDALKKRLTALEKIRDATKDLSVAADLQQQIFDLQVKITLRDAAKNGLSKEETDLAIAGFKNQLTEAFNREALALEAIPKVKVTDIEMVPLDSGVIESKIAKAVGLDKTIPIKSDRQVKIELLGLEFVLAQEEAKKALEKFKETIVNGAVEGIANIGAAFGEVLAGGSFAKAAQSFLSGIGGVLKELGKQMIATSTLIKSLKAALDSLFKNPVAGIAVGIGLVALGGLLKNIKIPGFASGVNNFSGGLAIVGERGPELVNLPRGSDVIPNHMLNGSQQPIILQPSVRFAGKDMYVMLQRVTESNKTVGGGSL